MVAAATGAADGAATSVLTIDRRLIGVVARTNPDRAKIRCVGQSGAPDFVMDMRNFAGALIPSSLAQLESSSTSSLDPNRSATLFGVKTVDHSGGREIAACAEEN